MAALTTGTTYFLQPSSGEVVKIGGTNGPPRRRPRDQSFDGGRELHLVGILNRPEADVQHQWKHLHLRGDWFTAGPDLIRFIRNAAEQTDEERKRFRSINGSRRPNRPRQSLEEKIAEEIRGEIIPKEELEDRLLSATGVEFCEAYESDCDCDDCCAYQDITLLDTLRILDDVILIEENKLLVASIGRFESHVRRAELDWLCGEAFQSLDYLGWTLSIISRDPATCQWPCFRHQQLPDIQAGWMELYPPDWVRLQQTL